jgi:hypothetical protein
MPKAANHYFEIFDCLGDELWLLVVGYENRPVLDHSTQFVAVQGLEF